MPERYEVDERVGCVAVVDTTTGKLNDGGLHPTDSGVVKYWSGRHVPRWKKVLRLAPDHATWEVPRSTLRKARRLARRLNRDDRTCREFFRDA